jgi:hypothetical protein
MPGGIKETGGSKDNEKGKLEHKKSDLSNTSFNPSKSTKELRSETGELKKEGKDSPGGSSTHHLGDTSKSNIFNPEGQKEDLKRLIETLGLIVSPAVTKELEGHVTKELEEKKDLNRPLDALALDHPRTPDLSPQQQETLNRQLSGPSRVFVDFERYRK